MLRLMQPHNAEVDAALLKEAEYLYLSPATDEEDLGNRRNRLFALRDKLEEIGLL